MMNMVDPIVSEPAAGPPQAEACLNCGAPLGGPFCSNCGQRAKLNRTLSSFLADFVAPKATGLRDYVGKNGFGDVVLGQVKAVKFVGLC